MRSLHYIIAVILIIGWAVGLKKASSIIKLKRL